MGLDSYLSAKKYYSGLHDLKNPELLQGSEAETIKVIVKSPETCNLESISFQVAYWRKQWHIHHFFSDRCTEDEESEFEVDFSVIQELFNACKTLLDKYEGEKSIKDEKFINLWNDFFPATELKEWQIPLLITTKDMLEKVMTFGKEYSFEYSASW